MAQKPQVFSNFTKKFLLSPFFDEKNVKKSFNKKQTTTAGKSLTL